MAKAADLRHAMSASAKTSTPLTRALQAQQPTKLAREGEPGEPREAKAEDNPHYRPGRAAKSNVTGYFPPEVKKQLRMLAAEKDTTIQGLLAEALNGLFAAHGKPEIAPLEEI